MSLDNGCAAPSARKTLSADEARRIILDTLSPVPGWERVAVRASLGRVLVEDVVAPCNVPAHDNSAMDGYAVRADDLSPDAESSVQVVDTAFAGRGFSGRICLAQGGDLVAQTLQLVVGRDRGGPRPALQDDRKALAVTVHIQPVGIAFDAGRMTMRRAHDLAAFVDRAMVRGGTPRAGRPPGSPHSPGRTGRSEGGAVALRLPGAQSRTSG